MKGKPTLAMAGMALAMWAGSVRGGAPELPVDLGSAGNFAVLAKTGISTVPPAAIVGDIGVSPIDATAITGFSLILDGSTQFATSPQVAGKVYAADYGDPTPAILTTAIGDMEEAYATAAGRNLPDATELGSGDIGGMTIAPGLYTWSSGVEIPADVTLAGGPNQVWIFQIAGDLKLAAAKSVFLSGGAQAHNIFWQVAGDGGVEIGTTAHFEGIILARTAIHLQTGASINGRLYAQTAVTLDANPVAQPDAGELIYFTRIEHTTAGMVLALTNTPGLEITLEHTADLDIPDWTFLSSETPAVSPYVTTDTTSEVSADVKRFYRAFYP
jgi:hypothetical protein